MLLAEGISKTSEQSRASGFGGSNDPSPKGPHGMKHLQLLIDAITEYPFQDDVLLFMAVCFLVLLILAYGMGDRANHHFTAERNEAFLRKMRASFGSDWADVPRVQPLNTDPSPSSKEVQVDYANRDKPGRKKPDTEETECTRLEEVSQSLSLANSLRGSEGDGFSAPSSSPGLQEQELISDDWDRKGQRSPGAAGSSYLDQRGL
jgi:hypothetical protein